MVYINGVPFVGDIHIDGLVNIDQVFDPKSENPQSGIAVAEAVKTALVSYKEATFDSLRDLVNEGKYVVLFRPDESGGIAYYTLFYDIEHVLVFGAVEGAAVKTISFYEGNEKTEQTTSLLSTRMVQQKYLPDSEYPISGKGVAEAMVGVGGDGVVYLTKDEADYELLKGYIDAGKTVIIKDDSSYLYLSAYDDDYVSFYSITGGNYGYIDYYSSGAVDEYWSPRTINEEDVQHDYDANSKKPISGQGVAEALKTVGQWQLIEEITLTDGVESIEKIFAENKYKEVYFYGDFSAPTATYSNIYITLYSQLGSGGFTQLDSNIQSSNYEYSTELHIRFYVTPAGKVGYDLSHSDGTYITQSRISYYDAVDGCIPGIKIYISAGSSSSQYMRSGSTVQIWGLVK